MAWMEMQGPEYVFLKIPLEDMFSWFITSKKKKKRERERIKGSFEVRISPHCYFSLHIFKVQVPFEDIALKLL